MNRIPMVAPDSDLGDFVDDGMIIMMTMLYFNNGVLCIIVCLFVCSYFDQSVFSS
jgi:hypothetical protein